MNRDLLVAELRRDEGVKYEPYLDTRGINTIGVGHNLVVHPLPTGWSTPLSDDQVNILLNDDIDTLCSAIKNSLPWFWSIDDTRQRVLANMGFNLGIDGLLEFKDTLHCVQTGDYKGAASAMSASKWATEVGNRATRLITAMSTGVMPDDPLPQPQ